MDEAKEAEGPDALAQMLHDREKYYENEKVRQELYCMLENNKTPLYLDSKQELKKLHSSQRIGIVAPPRKR